MTENLYDVSIGVNLLLDIYIKLEIIDIISAYKMQRYICAS